MKLFYTRASRAKTAERAKREAEEEATREATKAVAREERAKWFERENIERPIREAQERAAEAEAQKALSELAGKNKLEIENIFKDRFKSLKESIEAQFQEIKKNIKEDVNTVIERSKSTLDELKIDLATITMNQSLNDVDALLENLNPENLVNMLTTNEEECKMKLNSNLGSRVASVKVTKRPGVPKPYNPDSISSRNISTLNENPDGYRGGGSSKSSKKRRKPIKKRRNTKRRN